MNQIVLIIDPFLSEPATDAIHLISKIHFEILNSHSKFTSRIEFFFPSKEKRTLREFLEKKNSENTRIISVISLGSYAHITENLEWVKNLGIDLKELIIEKNIPFLGICFSHQLFASLYGSKVDYIENREKLPEKKYNEFRKIYTEDPFLISLLNGKKEFISKAQQEQEVKDYNPEFLDCIAYSDSCKIEFLKHKTFPAFSIQSHPEKEHPSGDGFYLLKNLLNYMLGYEK
jgi:GMP synthase-like glutamine amidotransferase